ncbi:MAG: ABC transporter permease subunit [Acetobacteraceae bacterium]|nr:ABC transporter permease subunit [Acetobacteraceae bacterium]
MTWPSLLFGANGWAPLLLQGALVTIALALISAPFGFGGGLLLALFKLSRSRTLVLACQGFTNFFRGIPDLLALFIVYFGLQALVNWAAARLGPEWHVEMDAFVAGAIALAVVIAAYSSEVWIASLHAVPRGQREAAYALGLDRRRAFRLVTLPQLIRVALPGLGNLWTILLKDTSLISTLAVTDLLRAASEASRATLRPILFYSAAALLYLFLSIASGAVQATLERRVNRGYA